MKVNLPYKKFLIIKKELLAPDTFLFRLKGHLDFEPGQFVQVLSPNIGEATFAPCSDPENDKHFELCVRISGNTTKAVSEMNPGEELLLRGPLGKGWPYGKLLDQGVAIIAGGMGTVPLRPLLYQFNKYQKEFKDIFLMTGCKTPDYLLFKDDKFKFKYDKVIFEKGMTGQSLEKGLITDLVEKVSIPKNTKVLICGPEVMFEPVCKVLNNKRIADSNIYVSFERRMECGSGFCQHCSIGKYLVCKDGPVFRWDIIKKELGK